jgi:hypothetical protein
MAISASDILSIVKKEDDFGHEVRVGAAIRAIAGFAVQHSGTYTDPVTGKPRQFDYRCWLTKTDRHFRITFPIHGATGKETSEAINQSSRLALTVECKNLDPCFPLVVCGTSRVGDEAYHELVRSIGPTLVAGQPHSENAESCRLHQGNRFYQQHGFIGKSLLRLKPKDPKSNQPVAAPDADVYEKWAQALSSAVDLAEAAFGHPDVGQVVWTAVLPVVVVPNNSLWKVAYDDQGNVGSGPQPTEHCEFYVGHQLRFGTFPNEHAFTFSHIHFFTLTGFGSFFSKMSSDGSEWERVFDPALLRFGPAIQGPWSPGASLLR